MKRRTTGATFATLGLLTGLLAGGLGSGATPALAMPRIAGVGLVTTEGTPLNARSGPAASSSRTGQIKNGTYVSIVCQVVGEPVSGTVRASSTVWDMLPNYSFIADAFITRDYYQIPVCGSAGDWMLPVVAPLVSGFRTASRPGHDGVDLGAARNSPIHAAAAGTVIRVTCNTPSNDCDVDGGIGVGGCGWYVEIEHPGAIVTRYCHLVRRPAVVIGQVVAEGAVLGYVGMSGNASGPHLHFEVHIGAPPATHENAISPIAFLRGKGLLIG